MHSLAKVSTAIRTLKPAKVIQSRLHARIFRRFATKLGFVYFGDVDQHGDVHRLVRGLTVSLNHKDMNYCVGSFVGYDIAVVERLDAVKSPHQPVYHQRWTILTVDLYHAKEDLPHIFMGLKSHPQAFYAQVFTKFSSMAPLPLTDARLLRSHTTYTEPVYFEQVSSLLTNEMMTEVEARLGNFALEIADSCVYVYADQRPSEQLLEHMLKYGVWLAKSIDDALIKNPL